jgi:hypothetical protein
MMIRSTLPALGIALFFTALPCLAQDPPLETPPSEPQDAQAQEKAEEKPLFVRVTRDEDDDPLALETVVVSYVSADGKRPGVSVDLVGAIHVGDREYYKELNKLFESYDVVLFELVAPEGTRIPKGGRQGGAPNPVMLLQNGMSGLLELKHQLDEVDYTKENFVHADMTPEEFAKSMKDRGESPLTIFLRLLEHSLVEQAKQQNRKEPAPEVDLFTLLFARDRAMRLKRMLADQFSDMDSALAVFDGPSGSTLVTDRNKKALSVLTRELDAGKKRIAIFYGAAHLPDMEKRLLEEFGMKRESEKWLTAWRLQ